MKKKYICAVAISLLYIPHSFADIAFNGFASIRASQASSDNGLTPFPEFKEGEIDFKGESLFGLQARADLGDGLSATIQMYAEGAQDFKLDARWAYLSYQANDTHRISAGRFANPIFHQSEYEVVGYAHNFSRLPKSVYLDFEFATIEGIALDSSFDVGDNTLTTKLLYGGWQGEVYIAALNQNIPLGFNNIISFNATYAGDWWSIFGGAFTTEIDGAQFDQQALGAFTAGGIALARQNGANDADVNTFNDAIMWDTKDGIYSFAGFNVDYNDWIVDFEYAYYGVDESSDGYNDTWFFALGKRFNDYVITIHTEEFNQEADFSVFNQVKHPILKATAQGIQTSLAAREFDGSGISLRYDFHSNAAFKFDYFKGQDSRAAVGDFTIISAGVDLVF
ncbi:hypothetical protein AADZ91_05275 [Colwelliaceae bacterium 6441]